MATRDGFIKKTPLREYASARTGVVAIALRDGDALGGVAACTRDDRLILATRKGKGTCFKSADARAMGRATQGVTGIRLEESAAIRRSCCSTRTAKRWKVK